MVAGETNKAKKEASYFLKEVLWSKKRPLSDSLNLL